MDERISFVYPVSRNIYYYFFYFSRADEVDDYEPAPRAEKIVLPSAPRASLGPNISDDRIPKEPPFTAYLANLSYDINPEDVYEFFGKLKINNVRLLRDGDQETGRLKG